MKMDLPEVAKHIAFVGVIILAFALMVPPVNASTDAQENEFQAIQDQIDAWCEEYNLPVGSVVFWGYDDLYGQYNAAGMCTPPNYMPQVYGYGDYCSIVLDNVLKDGRFDMTEKCLLFHEFAHAVDYFQDGVMSDHGEEFQDIMNTKPLYKYGLELSEWTSLSMRLMLR